LGIQIDVLIANAAVNLSPSYLVDIPPATFDLTFRTNVQGPLILFQAMRPLMKYPAKFIVITSGSGTINRKMAVGKGAYGMTKAAINYMANTVPISTTIEKLY
jgi:norsolorinic acid ketoreductase